MPSMLSAQAKHRLSQLLDQAVFLYKQGHPKEHVLEQIEEIVRTAASFSDQVVTNGEVKRKCNLGHWHVTYRLTFRTVLIPALRLLVNEKRPMTTGELAERLPTHVGRMMHYLGELRHWGLLTQQKAGVFEATEDAKAFLDGKLAVAAWLWPSDANLPPECVAGPTRFIDEMTDEHPKDDVARHVEEAFPA